MPSAAAQSLLEPHTESAHSKSAQLLLGSNQAKQKSAVRACRSPVQDVQLRRCSAGSTSLVVALQWQGRKETLAVSSASPKLANGSAAAAPEPPPPVSAAKGSAAAAAEEAVAAFPPSNRDAQSSCWAALAGAGVAAVAPAKASHDTSAPWFCNCSQN